MFPNMNMLNQLLLNLLQQLENPNPRNQIKDNFCFEALRNAYLRNTYLQDKKVRIFSTLSFVNHEEKLKGFKMSKRIRAKDLGLMVKTTRNLRIDLSYLSKEKSSLKNLSETFKWLKGINHLTIFFFEEEIKELKFLSKIFSNLRYVENFSLITKLQKLEHNFFRNFASILKGTKVGLRIRMNLARSINIHSNFFSQLNEHPRFFIRAQEVELVCDSRNIGDLLQKSNSFYAFQNAKKVKLNFSGMKIFDCEIQQILENIASSSSKLDYLYLILSNSTLETSINEILFELTNIVNLKEFIFDFSDCFKNFDEISMFESFFKLSQKMKMNSDYLFSIDFLDKIINFRKITVNKLSLLDSFHTSFYSSRGVYFIKSSQSTFSSYFFFANIYLLMRNLQKSLSQSNQNFEIIHPFSSNSEKKQNNLIIDFRDIMNTLSKSGMENLSASLDPSQHDIRKLEFFAKRGLSDIGDIGFNILNSEKLNHIESLKIQINSNTNFCISSNLLSTKFFKSNAYLDSIHFDFSRIKTLPSLILENFACSVKLLPRLERIHLNLNHLNFKKNDYLNTLFESLVHARSLLCLELQLNNNQDLTNDSLIKLSESLKKFSKLEVFIFDAGSCKSVSDDGLISLSQGISCLYSLKKLKLIFSGTLIVKNVTLKEIAIAIGSLKNLQDLDTDFCALNLSSIPSISDALIRIHSLVNISFRFYKIEETFFKDFTEAVKLLKRLENLEIESSKFCDNYGPFYDFLEVIKYIDTIRGLKLSIKNTSFKESLKDDGLNKISKSLLFMKSLKDLKLNFEGQDFYDKALIIFSSSISKLRELKKIYLNFSVCRLITGEGIKDLFNTISKLVSLQELTLEFPNPCALTKSTGSELGDDQVKELSISLLNLDYLETINVNFSACYSITDNGLQNLSKSLGQIFTLKKLSINLHNCHNIAKISHVTDHLINFTRLEELIIFCSESLIDDDSIQNFSSSLRTLRNLKKFHIHFYKCQKITDEGVAFFIESCYALTKVEDIHFNFGLINFSKNIANMMDNLLLNLHRVNSAYVNFKLGIDKYLVEYN